MRKRVSHKTVIKNIFNKIKKKKKKFQPFSHAQNIKHHTTLHTYHWVVSPRMVINEKGNQISEQILGNLSKTFFIFKKKIKFKENNRTPLEIQIE